MNFLCKHVVVSGVASDAHTWNLVFLQKFIEEMGYRVTNFGPCVPDSMLVARCRELRADLVVLSSVNGHGHIDGARVVRKLRDQPALRDTPIVIGGKLGVSGAANGQHASKLLTAGFDAVFDDSVALAEFGGYLSGLTAIPA